MRAEYGLFTRVAITIPKHRIQLIGFRSNPFHRLCRRVSIKVETAGLTGSEENRSSLRWLAPILPEKEAPRVLSEVQPEVDWGAMEWRPLHQRTFARLLRIRLIWLAIATLVLAWTTGVTGFLALLAFPMVLAYARGYFRYAGWAVTPTAIAHRSGWVVKQQSIVRYPKIQVVTLTRNPFDRRWGMATVSADTAGADPAGHAVRIRFLDTDSALALRDLLEEKTQA
ncbi:MAG: PH domain-containing protein, partial [Opitutales bacterium]